jgi:hypothetical protein
LTPDEVIELTGCKRRDTQCRRLAQMQIPFRPNYAGRPLVERAAVLAYKEAPGAPAGQRKAAEPNWDALDAA